MKQPTSSSGTSTQPRLNLCRAPAYPYRTLFDTDVRLMKILPGIGCIECVLHQLPWESVGGFNALSYVWGDQSETKEILLEGESFQITKNLHEALLQIRDLMRTSTNTVFLDLDLYLWVDAICLNQKDVEEKSMQVPRMVDIYESAWQVLVWLGPNKAHDRSKRVDWEAPSPPVEPTEFFKPMQSSRDDMIELLFEKVESLYKGWETPDETAEDEPTLRETFGQAYPAVLRASGEILYRPWFVRVWTAQEACLDNATVLSGRHWVNLKKLVVFLKAIAKHHQFVVFAPGFSRLLGLQHIQDMAYEIYGHKLRGILLEYDAAECLYEIFSWIPDRRSSDPRDQLYGLLGVVKYLTRKALPLELAPDYNLPFEDVYWRYVSFLFQNTGDLRFLAGERRELQGVPSWVIDLRYPGSIHREAACKGFVTVSDDKRELYLQGLRMGYVCDYVEEYDYPRTYPGIYQPTLPNRIRYVEGRIFKPAAHIRGVPMEEILEGILGRPNAMFKQGGMKGVQKAYTELRGHTSRSGGWAWLSKRGKSQTVDTYGKDYFIIDDFKRPFLLLEDGTVLCINRKGVDVLPGDLVCLFKGATNASLLRPSDRGFLFLGHCDVRSGTFYLQRFQRYDEDFWAGKRTEEFRLI